MEAPTAVAAEEHFPSKDLQNIHPVSVKNWSAGMLHVVITCLNVYQSFVSFTAELTNSFENWQVTIPFPSHTRAGTAMV